jgi:hypothetical protein
MAKAFSAEVAAGSAQKMRQPKELEHFCDSFESQNALVPRSLRMDAAPL